MTEAVLDASVILAIARNERLDSAAYALMDGGVMSAVNVAEVYSKLAELKLAVQSVELILSSLAHVAPFTKVQARAAGLLRASTRHVGLSLGDRACLALAIELGGTAYTTEHRWSQVTVGCQVRLLR